MERTNNKQKLVIIDGNSLVYRAFHALPLLSNREGIFTNAVYGFVNMFFKVLKETNTEYIIVAFDKSKITFRHERYEDYKGSRRPMPEELRPQFVLIKRFLRAMNIHVLEREGFEADDLIGSVVTRAGEEGIFSIIISGDRDSLQLVSSQTEVWLTRKGISEFEVIGEKTFHKRYGIAPRQIIDVKALMGDVSDNIPGVPSIGEKTALRLIREFGNLEALFSNLDKIRGKTAEKLREYEEQARLSRFLATIRCDLPLNWSWEECRNKTPRYEELLKLFKELEFKSLIGKILASMKETPQVGVSKNEKIIFRSLEDEAMWPYFVREVYEAGVLAIFPLLTEGDYRHARFFPIGLACREGETWVLEGNEGFSSSISKEKLRELLKEPEVKIYMHGAKSGILALRGHDLYIKALSGDTQLAAYLLDPSQGDLTLSHLCLEYMEEAFVEDDDPVRIAGYSAEKILKLIAILHERIVADSLDNIYYHLELPLVAVLAQMEENGIK